jgi:hypothetical protein
MDGWMDGWLDGDGRMSYCGELVCVTALIGRQIDIQTDWQ